MKRKITAARRAQLIKQLEKARAAREQRKAMELKYAQDWLKGKRKPGQRKPYLLRKKASKKVVNINSAYPRAMLEAHPFVIDTAKFNRCVKEVRAKSKRVNPYAVCNKSLGRKRKTRKVNPAPLLYIITAQGTGKKMHYDGEKFSERARVRTFPTVEAARAKAVNLIVKYPVLRKYKVRIETNQHRPK